MGASVGLARTIRFPRCPDAQRLALVSNRLEQRERQIVPQDAPKPRGTRPCLFEVRQHPSGPIRSSADVRKSRSTDGCRRRRGRGAGPHHEETIHGE